MIKSPQVSQKNCIIYTQANFIDIEWFFKHLMGKLNFRSEKNANSSHFGLWSF